MERVEDNKKRSKEKKLVSNEETKYNYAEKINKRLNISERKT